MDGFVFLAPLAIVGYAGAVLALGIAIRYSAGAKLPIQLEAVSSSSSSLPTPASSSTSSLKSTVVRGVRSATSTLKVTVRIPLTAVPRWSSLTELIAKRRRKRIMLEELPTTASVDDNPIPPVPATPEHVLVDLTETSNVLSPLIPMRVLGAATLVIRSPTPLLPTSISDVLATSRSSVFTLDSYSAPSTPPPYRGHNEAGHQYESISPFASPPLTASRMHDFSARMPRSASPNVIFPHSRPRTPSPVYNNPHFLATSPVLRHHRRARSFGGISIKRVAASPTIPRLDLPRNGSGTLVAGSFGQKDFEMKPYLHHPLSSRSTERLIDLEDGVGSGRFQGHSPSSDDGVLVNLEDGKESNPGPSSARTSSGSSSPLLLHSPVAVRPLGFEIHGAEDPRTATNNSWRQWETEDRDLLAMDEDYDLARFNTFETGRQTTDPFGDLFAESPPVVKSSEDSSIDRWASSSVEGDPELKPPRTVGVKPCSPSNSATPSQMPTPPASPPFSLLRMPSTSSYPVSPVEASGEEQPEVQDMAIVIGGRRDVALDQQEEWEEVSGEEVVVLGELLEQAVGTEEAGQDETTESSELLCDDPPLPELPLLEAVDFRKEADTPAMDEAEGEAQDIHTFDDPPLPEIEVIPSIYNKADDVLAELDSEEIGSHIVEETPAQLAEVSSLPISPAEEKERPAWSLRASEAPRLGLPAESEPVPVEKQTTIAQKSSAEIHSRQVSAPEPITRSDSIPGAFPSAVEAEPKTHPAAAAAFPEKEKKPSTSTLAPPSAPPRRRTTSTIDTSSFAAAIVSLRRKPEPLDVALAMQMRPGVGAGADPAWMVRFMMAVFGWLAVTVSAGID